MLNFTKIIICISTVPSISHLQSISPNKKKNFRKIWLCLLRPNKLSLLLKKACICSQIKFSHQYLQNNFFIQLIYNIKLAIQASLITLKQTGWRVASNRSQVFYKIDVLKNFAKIKEKQLCRSLSSNKVTGPQPER